MDKEKTLQQIKKSVYFFVPFALVWIYKVFQGPQVDALTTASASTSDTAIPEVISYNFDVKPILSDKCYACHGPDQEALQANLRLNTEAGAFGQAEQLSSLPIIKKGDPLGSALIIHINSTDPKSQMPPPDSNLFLTARQKQILEKWVAQGAPWEGHWAYQAPQKPTPPKTEQSKWVNNPIDQFIASKLADKGLTPSAAAEKEILLRRLSFDLTGLPPSLELMDQYLSDNSDNAYEKMVDHLL
ncbi:MAG: DUF1549 domain-containing protein, partial [Flavobacteriaceae bacterium]